MSLDPQSVPFLRSCERCRHKKRKCSGERPSCAWCSSHNIPCRYRRTMRFKKQLEGQPESSLNALTIPVMFSSASENVAVSGADLAASQAPLSPPPTAIPMCSMAPASMASPEPSMSLPGLASAPGRLFSADALAKLLSVDMVPQTNPPSANLLQVVNSFMTPLAGAAPMFGSEWSALSNTEASMLANLGGVATSAQRNPSREWMPVGFNEPLMDGGNKARLSQDFFSDEILPPFGADGGGIEAVDIMKSAMPGQGPVEASPGLGQGMRRPSEQPALGVAMPRRGPSLPTAPVERQGVPLHPAVEYIHTNLGPPQPRSPVVEVSEIMPGMLTGIGRSSPLAAVPGHQTPMSKRSGAPTHRGTTPTSTNSSTGHTGSSAAGYPAAQIKPRPQNYYERRPAAGSSAAGRGEIKSALGSESVAVPEILREYVASIPGNPSPAVIYRIMRETFRAPRMGMISMNLEMLWYMLHKGVLPRIVFYGHISSTIRCSVADLDIKSMVPAHIDESCYELALSEVPLVKDCAAVWGAVGLCMVARYEFQSSRYNEMADHADMALDIMHRIRYAGVAYPWHAVPAAEKESFGFQYMLAIFWKCFLWKLMSLMLIDRSASFAQGLEVLPEYSSKTYDLYTSHQPYDVDLMEMIPPGSWHGADPEHPPSIRFRGPSDAEFMRLRPDGSPCFDRGTPSGSYMQQLMVVFASFFELQGRARAGEIGLSQLLKGLWVYKERMRMWRYSLPADLILDSTMVEEYLKAIRPGSEATARDIDLHASRLKEVLMLLMTYHTFVVRANRCVMKMMLGEPLNVPAPDVNTMAFGIRDLYDSKDSPAVVTEGLGHMNMYFHGCRIQAVKSANALCSILQAAYSCRFNFYTLGSHVVFTIFELLVVYLSFLRNCDANIVWRSKARLSNVFNILRMLRHWAPALHIFVAGIKALSDPGLCVEEPRNFDALKRDVMDPSSFDMMDSPVDSAAASDTEVGPGILPPKRRRVVRMPLALETIKDARTNILNSIAPRGLKLSTDVRRDETLSYQAADPIPEFPNPFPQKHIISLVIKDLGLSLAEFLAPAYPILLLKLIPTNHVDPSKKLNLFGNIGGMDSAGSGAGGSDLNDEASGPSSPAVV
ncbi:hypothetical protein GGI07_003088 [Coemansia sp. Benny D115]|nr:hypothetical protein GGI07_003088 [Coemansia sp. Benny D115]